MKPIARTTLRKILFAGWCIGALGIHNADAQHGAVGGEWRHYGGDAGGTKYSPLDQINADRQFIVVAVGAAGFPAELVALALPRTR